MKLRHVVLFAFNETGDAAEVVRRFAALQDSVPGIEAFEWGENCSPEGLDHGHSHAFLLTFATAKARDAYLVHPEHTAFGAWVKPLLASVTVVDYWVANEAAP
jgi:hypothetical protein